MNEKEPQSYNKSDIFRFEILKGKIDSEGKFVKTREAGQAFLKSGKMAYKAKLFMIKNLRFFVVPGDTPENYKILVNEEVRLHNKTMKTYWDVVGEGQILPELGLMKLKFDLFGEALYMNLSPVNGGNVLPFEINSKWVAEAS